MGMRIRTEMGKGTRMGTETEIGMWKKLEMRIQRGQIQRWRQMGMELSWGWEQGQRQGQIQR